MNADLLKMHAYRNVQSPMSTILFKNHDEISLFHFQPKQVVLTDRSLGHKLYTLIHP